MALEKKEEVHVNMVLSRQVRDQMKEYAEAKEQILTTTVERILIAHLCREQEKAGKEDCNVCH